MRLWTAGAPPASLAPKKRERPRAVQMGALKLSRQRLGGALPLEPQRAILNSARDTVNLRAVAFVCKDDVRHVGNRSPTAQ